MTGKTTPLYVVCSSRRCVGTTLVSRLLTEFYIVHDRPVAAFDLADEGPQLADYLPKFATIADIGDIDGQMALFDQLIAEIDTPRVIDVSHRAFKNFFTIVQEISFFEEARRRSIEPLILFIIDPNAESPESYAMLRRRFTQTSLLAVRNQIGASSAHAYCDASQKAMRPSSLDIPPLGFSLRTVIDRPTFSFSQFWRAIPPDLPEALDEKLGEWVEQIFSQFRDLAFSLGGEGLSASIAARRSRHLGRTHRQWQLDVKPPGDEYQGKADLTAINRSFTDAPDQVLNFAPKQKRGIDSDPIGNTIVAMLQKAADRWNDDCARVRAVANELSHQLRATEGRINELETEIGYFRDRAVRAETWLQMIQREIEEKLIAPTAATRSKSTT